MSNEASVAVKIILALAAGAAANFALTIIAAPGQMGTALAVGLLLTSFGMMFAAFSMQAVMLPLGIISMMLRLVRRENLTKSGAKHDRMEILGRILFVAVYAVISSLTGIYVGALAGGMGWFLGAICFAVLGILLAILLPTELIWAIDDDGSVTAETSSTQHEQLKQAVKNNEPVAVFTDKVAKNIVNVVTGGKSVDKPNGRNP